MKMTKESIFPLYVGKCKVKVKRYTLIDGINQFTGEYTYDLDGVILKNNIIIANLDEYDISDCTLLLKPLSKMSEDDKKIYDELISQFVFFDTYEVYQKEAVRLTLWLIQHGYAISDKLFELKIAEKTNG